MLGIYCRISRDRKKQVSIEVQRTYGETFANAKNLEYEVYIDKGISGRGNSGKRPEYTRLISDIESGKITELYIYERSRNDRDIRTWIEIADIIKGKKIALYIKGEHKDLNDIDTYYQLVQYAVYDQKFADETAVKIKEALLLNAQESKRFGILPYGYGVNETNHLIVDPEESAVVKSIYRMSLNGIGTDKIAMILNSDGVPTRYNKLGQGTLTTKDRHSDKLRIIKKTDITWSGHSVRLIISNPHYKGQRKWQGNYYPCPPIFTPEYWQQVNDNFKNNTNTKGRAQTYDYLLKGSVRCGKCGRNYYGRTRENKKDHYYMCSSKRRNVENCGNRSINIDVLDHVVWLLMFDDNRLLNEVFKYFENNSKDNTIESLRSKLDKLETQKKDVDRRRNKLIDLEISGSYTEEELKPKRELLKQEDYTILRDAKRIIEQIAHHERIMSQKESIKNELGGGIFYSSYNDKKALIQKYIKDIVVTYKDDSAEYQLDILINVPDAKPITFFVDRGYNKAVSVKSVEAYIPEGDGLRIAENVHITYDLKHFKK